MIPDTTQLKAHLLEEYQGVFTPQFIDEFIETYVGLDTSRDLFTQVANLTGIQAGDHLLDVGSGYGSFVIACRKQGVQAVGIDIAPFDLDYARQRWARDYGSPPADQVYMQMNAQLMTFPDGCFDVVTAWNVLEHVPDYMQMLREVHRVLKPGGFFIGVAPNYLAFRQEAHYHVPWLPLMYRPLAVAYLQMLGKNPAFFQNGIFYVTRLGVMRAMQRIGFTLIDPPREKLAHPNIHMSGRAHQVIQLARRMHLVGALRLALTLRYWYPLQAGIFVVGERT